MKKILISIFSLLIIFSNFAPWSVSAANEIKVSLTDISSSEYIEVDGERLYLKKEITDEYRKGQVVTEDGEIISEFILDLVNDKANLDGVELTDQQYEDIVQLGKEGINSDASIMPLKNTSEFSTMSACAYRQVGSTKYRSTWIPKTGAAAVAAAISVAVPGVGWSAAWAIAGVVAGSTNTLYYTVREYTCTKNGTYHLRTTRSFYKNSNYTGHLGTFSVYGSRR